MSQQRRTAKAGKPSLIVGSALVGLLTVLNVASWFVPEERSNLDFRFAPPHPSLTRFALWSPARADSSSVFLNDPLPVGRVGRRWEYRPRTTIAVADFVLRGEPAGLKVDPGTGLITGTPESAGKFEVVLEGRLADGSEVANAFTLLLDDRYLVLGADERGRDLLRRLIVASRYTMIPALIAVLVGVVGGTYLGAVAGFRHGWPRSLLMSLSTCLQSVPGLLLVFLGSILSGFNLWVVMGVIGIILLPETAKGVSERVESFRRRDFIDAARELGLDDRSILWKEIIWYNARAFVLGRLAQGFLFAILTEITLTYLGLARNDGSLGDLLIEGRLAFVTGESRALGMVALGSLLLLVTAFALLEQGIRGRWERRR